MNFAVTNNIIVLMLVVALQSFTCSAQAFSIFGPLFEGVTSFTLVTSTTTSTKPTPCFITSGQNVTVCRRKRGIEEKEEIIDFDYEEVAPSAVMRIEPTVAPLTFRSIVDSNAILSSFNDDSYRTSVNIFRQLAVKGRNNRIPVGNCGMSTVNLSQLLSCLGLTVQETTTLTATFTITKTISSGYTTMTVAGCTPTEFTQMCITTIANLMQNSTKEGASRQYFSRDREIVPYVDSHWEYLTTMPRRVTQSWHSTIHKTLMKEKGLIFVCQEPVPETMASDCMFGLLSLELVNIRPNYEAMVRAGHLKQTDTTGGNTAGIRGRGYKRRVPDQFGGNQRKTRNDIGTPKLPAHGYPLDHPFNKDGYRYILAEPDPHAPFRQEFDESSDWAGKPIPGWLYRKLNPSQVLLTLHDRAPQLKITEDRMAATGEKGYCTVRATHFVNRGTWYWECTIEEMPELAATRIGFAQAYGNLQAPLGYDKFGYSWRSRKGTVFHESLGKHFSQGYGEGDVLGILIELPEISSGNYIPPTYKDKPLVKFKSHLYYEDRDEVQEELRNLKPLKGAKIDFYKNGIHQGTGFKDVYAGGYFPAISLFKNVTVSVNFGPNFKFAPKEVAFRGMHERAEESITEQAMADMLYLTENEGRLRLDL
uniref:EOG090X03NS n=1 Tax=Daphnia longispina TaxID=42846 RepID=A0A4Y7M6U5_9CRUS|nr:EOG090X03NS [Daphnia longispina]